MLNALSPLLFLGLGALLQKALFSGRIESAFLRFSQAYSLGLLANLILALILKDLSLCLVLSAALALPGLYFFVKEFSRGDSFGPRLALFSFLLLLFGLRIMMEPIQKWDARSIWFFQGKMIYFSSSLGVSWDPLTYLFANLDYPKLQPLLAAETAYLAGYWNEILPKLSLVHLFLPIAAFFSYLARKSFGYLAFLLLALFVPGSLLWEGYMDGYLSLYILMGAFFLGRLLLEGEKRDFTLALIPLGVAASLKNDGALLFFSLGFACLLSLYIFRSALIASLAREWRRNLPILVTAVLPFLIWNAEKIRLDIPSQIYMGEISFSLVWSRIVGGGLMPIFSGMATYGKILHGLSLLILCASLFGLTRVRARLGPLTFLGLATTIYCVGITGVLISTTMDLHLPQHLPYNLGRLMLSALQMVFLAIYFLDLESAEGEK